jgi:hypothetical protein
MRQLDLLPPIPEADVPPQAVNGESDGSAAAPKET